MTTSVSTRSAGTLNPTRQQLDELDALLQRMLELPVNKLEDAEPEAAEEMTDEPPPSTTDLDEQPTDAGWSSPQPSADADRPPLQLGTRPAPPPVSYMVIETASPRPLPPASGFEPRPSPLTPRLVPMTPDEVETGETPVPPQDQTDETPVPPHDETPVPTNEEEMWVPLRSTWKPSAQTWQPLAESWHQANSGLPTPESAPSSIPSPPFELSPPVGDASQALPEVRLGSPDLPPPTTDAPFAPPAPSAEPQLSLSAEDAPDAVPSLLLPLVWFNQGFDACLAPLGAPGRWLCGPHGRQMLGLAGLACLAAAAVVAVGAGMGWTW